MPRKKKCEESITTSFYLNKSIHERFSKYCEKTGRSKTWMIERILEDFLDKNEDKIEDLF